MRKKSMTFIHPSPQGELFAQGQQIPIETQNFGLESSMGRITARVKLLDALTARVVLLDGYPADGTISTFKLKTFLGKVQRHGLHQPGKSHGLGSTTLPKNLPPGYYMLRIEFARLENRFSQDSPPFAVSAAPVA